MKQLISLAMALILCLALCACGGNEATDHGTTGTTGNSGDGGATVPSDPAELSPSVGLEFFPYSNGTCAVTGVGTCTDTEIVIPAEWEGFKVTRIDSEAFRNCSTLISIVIPEGVTYVGRSAFKDCVKLKSVTIPDSVTEINEDAFYGCYLLNHVRMSSNLIKIHNEAFDLCYSLTEITIPASVTHIGLMAFGGCTRLATIYFGGTKEQWTEIKKGILPNSDESDIGFKSCTIYCADGEIVVNN